MAKHTTPSHHDDMGGVDFQERHTTFVKFVKTGFVTGVILAVVLLLLARFFT